MGLGLKDFFLEKLKLGKRRKYKRSDSDPIDTSNP
jgi:hypothetical protein